MNEIELLLLDSLIILALSGVDNSTAEALREIEIWEGGNVDVNDEVIDVSGDNGMLKLSLDLQLIIE